MQDKTGIPNYPDLLKAVSEIRRMVLNRALALEDANVRGQEREARLGNRWRAAREGNVTKVWGAVRGCPGESSSMQTSKQGWDEWCIFITGSNYSAHLSSRQAFAGVQVHLFNGTTDTEEDDKIPRERCSNYKSYSRVRRG